MTKPTCSIAGCSSPSRALRMCSMHYQRSRVESGKTKRVGRRPETVEETHQRFWSKVTKTGTCWWWDGSKERSDYGHFSMNSQDYIAHRIAYQFAVGSIPEGMQIDHTCHNRACVNPEHLRLATNKQNQENHLGAQSNSSSGVRGVTKARGSNRWYVAVGHNGVQHNGGYFDTIAEAEAAAIALRNKLFTHNDVDRKAA